MCLHVSTLILSSVFLGDTALEPLLKHRFQEPRWVLRLWPAETPIPADW